MSSPRVPAAPTKPSASAEISAFVEAARQVPATRSGARGRLIFALDATMSRQATWDLAQGLQARHGPSRLAVRRVSRPLAEHHDGGVASRNAAPRLQLDARQRQIGGPQRMSLRVRIFFAHIEQRDLLTRQQSRAHGAWRLARPRVGGTAVHSATPRRDVDAGSGEYPETKGRRSPSSE